MTPRKLNVFLATFPYSGNSTGTAMTWPAARWLIHTMSRLRVEEKFRDRIGSVKLNSYADTPITMTRNLAVKEARQAGCDAILMLDSDMHPDVHLGERPDAVPFFDTAFDRIYSKWDEGPRVVAAPYMGSPPFENGFVFVWEQHANLGEEAPFELRQYTRSECARMSGIHEAAALPTGCIMYDMRCFDLIAPPYFQYEWTDETQSKKASTEDVQNTRDISLSGIKKLGYNPCECAWSCWAGHLKNWCVKSPNIYGADLVSKTLQSAMGRAPTNERLVMVENLISPEVERLLGGNDAPGYESPSRLRRPAPAGEVEGIGGAHRTISHGTCARDGQEAEAQEVRA